jgi:hypothetical protein
MRQVLELLATLITVNPDTSVVKSLKTEMLQRLLSIISHKSAQPLVKPAFKTLECLLGKRAFLAAEIIENYGVIEAGKYAAESVSQTQMAGGSLQNSFVSDIFEWMSLPDTSPAAGKLLVTYFQSMRKSTSEVVSDTYEVHTLLWQRWIRRGLAKHPESLENVKNYLFPPLFKLDKTGSLEFLKELAHGVNIDTLRRQESNGQALLLLSAMEVGKKLGLVDELSMPSIMRANINLDDSS